MKDIPGYEGLYAITEDGKVWSYPKTFYVKRKNDILKRTTKGKFLIGGICDGYNHVRLSKNGKYTNFRVHRLVAIAYIPNIHNKPQVNHKNGVRTDNRVENLEWMTNQENVQDGWDRGRKPSRVSDIKHRKKIIKLNLDGCFIEKYNSVKEAGDKNNLSASAISKCARGLIKTSGNFIWRYI